MIVSHLMIDNDAHIHLSMTVDQQDDRVSLETIMAKLVG